MWTRNITPSPTPQEAEPEVSPSTGSTRTAYPGRSSSTRPDRPAPYRTGYFSVPDFAGNTGHFVIKDLTGGKIYSIADNVARQQLNEPFSRKVGLQVDTTTGSFGYQATDLTVSGAMPLTLQRFYVTQSDQYGELGYRWSQTYDTQLVLDSDGNAGVVFGSGAEEFFAWNSAYSTFSPADARTHDPLVKEADGSFTFTAKSNLTYHFDTSGVLQTIADLNGNTITLAYDGSGRLSTVTDPAGQALTYSYDANNRLSTVTDPVGAVVTYTYDSNGDLSTVTDPEGGVWTYQYDRHRLTQVADPNAKTLFTNTYDTAIGSPHRRMRSIRRSPSTTTHRESAPRK